MRVSGLANARLADVVCVVDSSRRKPNTDEDNQEITDALDKIDDLISEKEASEAEADILLDYAKSLTGALLPLDKVTAFLEKTVLKKVTIAKHVRKLQKEIRELEKFVEKTRQPVKGQTRATATINVVANKDGSVRLNLSYRAWYFQRSRSYILTL